eukprot:1314374-Pyramimonas_sp.AAC.1
MSLAKGPTACSCEYCVVGIAFGGAPHGATALKRGAPKWAAGHMWTMPLEPSAEITTGPQSS